MEGEEEDKSPELQKKKKKEYLRKSLELKPEYLDRKKVQSRLFGQIQDNREAKVDWKNLEKLSKEAIGKSDLPLERLVSLQKVLENELVRLDKLDEKLTKELKKVKNQKFPYIFIENG